MDLSIIIVNWNVKELILRLISSIFKYSSGLKYEIIVIDNDSKDGSIDALKETFREALDKGQLKIIANNYNAGFAKANNQGWQKASGHYLLFMNPDMELMENSFEKMLNFMDSNSAYSAATCRLLYADKSLQPNIKSFPRLTDQLLVILKLHHFLKFLPSLKRYLMKGFDYLEEIPVDQIMGAFVFIRREAFENVGTWDESYWLWWEDVELCKRLNDAGSKIAFTPITQIIHYEGKSFVQTFGLKKQKRFNRGMLNYFKKHRPKHEYYILWLCQPLSLLLTLITQVLKIKARPQSRI